jgi:hypothetical protein
MIFGTVVVMHVPVCVDRGVMLGFNVGNMLPLAQRHASTCLRSKQAIYGHSGTSYHDRIGSKGASPVQKLQESGPPLVESFLIC